MAGGELPPAAKSTDKSPPSSPIELIVGLSSDVIVEVHAPEDLHRYVVYSEAFLVHC